MASNTQLKFQIMKVMYATARKKGLLIAGILLLGCMALGYCYYVCCKKGDMEKIPVIYSREEDEDPYIWDSNEDDDSDVIG